MDIMADTLYTKRKIVILPKDHISNYNIMNIQKALDLLLDGRPIVVSGRTFTSTKYQKIHLTTGDTQYWFHCNEPIWLSVDPDSEEVIMFEDIDEEVEAVDDVVPYGGEDHELSVEQSGKVLDEEDEQLDVVEFNDYESHRGQIIRLTEYEVSEDSVDVALGRIVTEEDLQNA